MIEDIVDRNGFDYVDLGLPSRTLWATQNIGASKPSDSGLYFQWGDIQGYKFNQVGKDKGQKAFTWDDYKWSINGNSKNLNKKYIILGKSLEPEDDAAHVHMGGEWHIPSPDQIWELLDNTISEWSELNDVNGMKFISKKDNSKSIFFPAAGYAKNGTLDYCKRVGSIWSSRLSSNTIRYGQQFYFLSEKISLNSYARYCGFSVRGVIG